MKKLSATIFVITILLAQSAAQASILNIQTVISGKGITAWLVEDQTVPVLSVQFAFLGAGSVNDPEGKQGVSQILSNTLDEGAGDLDAKAFQAALNDNSISLSFASSRDNFSGSLKTLTKYQDTAFELLRLSLSEPRFDEEAIIRMREANMARIRSNMSDPEWLAARLSNAVIFEGHLYAGNSGGTLSSLPLVTADDLHKKLGTQFSKKNLVIAVAGNITPQDLIVYLDKVFGNLPEDPTLVSIEKLIWPQEPRTIQYDKEIPQTQIEIAYPGIGRTDPDYFAGEVMNYIFGGAGFGSRLTEVVREQNGLTYGIFSGTSEMDYASVFSIETSTRAEKTQDVLSLIDEEILRIVKDGVTEKELREAKSYLLGSVPLSLTSTDRIASVMLGFQAEHLPSNYLDIREREIKKVTLDDVKRSAGKILSPAAKTVLLLGKHIEASNIRRIETLPDIE
ncbi:MAG: pitrilysin family protein [Pseudobdellovibrionaceae bacterium]|jgi:zinc protease|nr:pitrilysin family protein [Pseudobdellovibrionaceae bacterium]